MKIDNIEIENSESEKLLVVDCNLNFNFHLNSLCKKASSKIHALARLHASTYKKIIDEFVFQRVIWILPISLDVL